MSVITPEGTLIIENSHLDVRGNVNAVALKLGTARLTPSYDLAAVTGVGNSTPYTVEFSNATTGLATTSNLQVGGTLKLGGTVDFENPLSLAAVSLVSNTTPYTIEFSNAATGIATTANVDVGGELAVTGNATVSSNLTVSGDATVTGNTTVSSNLTVSGGLEVGGDLGSTLLNTLYPVGMVLAMVQNWGGFAGQTWVQFAQGRTLVGQDSSDTAFDGVTPTAYIGEKSHILTNAEMPPHTHTEEGGEYLYQPTSYVAGTHPHIGLGYADTDTSSTGGGQAHNNVQPYEVVYYYKRTA